MQRENTKLAIPLAAALCGILASPNAMGLSLQNMRSIEPITIRTVNNPRPISGERVQINLYMPKQSGPMTVEVLNHTNMAIGLIRFQLAVLGGTGTLEFSSIPRAGVARNSVHVPTSHEVEVKNVIVFDNDATERYPRTVVQVIRPSNQGRPSS